VKFEARPIVVLIVAYGHQDLLQECLQTLGGTFTTIIVDNSSSAATKELASEAGAIYVDPEENLGFASGVNRGLSMIDLNEVDVLLLNPDATITPPTIELLRLQLALSPKLGCVAPAQHQPGTDTRSPVRWPFPSPGRAWLEALGLSKFARNWEYVIASILLIRGTALLEVGGFDEGFFLYSEETDWERRATNKGWRMGYCADALASHVGAATDDDRHRRLMRSHSGTERYIRKWHHSTGWRIYQAASVVTALRRALMAKGARRERFLLIARLYADGPVRTARNSGALPYRSTFIPELTKGPKRPLLP
jgi:GT2 family glycosyltransferase